MDITALHNTTNVGVDVAVSLHLGAPITLALDAGERLTGQTLDTALAQNLRAYLAILSDEELLSLVDRVVIDTVYPGEYPSSDHFVAKADEQQGQVIYKV